MELSKDALLSFKNLKEPKLSLIDTRDIFFFAKKKYTAPVYQCIKVLIKLNKSKEALYVLLLLQIKPIETSETVKK